MSALRYEDRIPLRWQELEALPTGQEQERIAHANSRLLQLLPSLEDTPEHTHDEDPPPRYIQILELRLQLLTELLADLLAQSRPLPPVHVVSLTADSVEWQDAQPPTVGSSLLVEVFLHPLLPRPLCLAAEVMQLEPQEESSLVRARLHIPADTAQAELEKLIFRQHRRAVASRRKQRPAQEL